MANYETDNSGSGFIVKITSLGMDSPLLRRR